MRLDGYDDWLWKQADEYMQSLDPTCPHCGEEDCECEYCHGCKRWNGCTCDEEYESWRDRQRDL